VGIQLDLRRDFAEISAYVAQRVRTFDPARNPGPGNGGPVKRVDVGYESDQAGWVAVVFDTRPNAEPDGQWTFCIPENKLERPRWLEANEALREDDLAVVLPDGSQVEIPAVGQWGDRYEQLATVLGQTLRAVLLQARADGVFTPLPKAAGCELGVEHFNGAYGWPQYEARGEDNLAEPGAAPEGGGI
jgi:hypothetical protein